MKNFVDGILVIFTCFVIVSPQQDFPSESAYGNTTTELPCNPENGCNTTETGATDPETSTSSVTNTALFDENNATLCPENGCQTESSSLEVTTEAIGYDNGTVVTHANVNSSEPVEESTTVVGGNVTEAETQLPDVTNSTESRTTVTETSTQPLSESDSWVNVTTYPDDSYNSSVTEVVSTSTDTVEASNSSLIVTNVSSEMGNYSEVNVTTEAYSETATEMSNHTEDTTNVTWTDTPLFDTNTTLRNAPTTEFPLFTNSTNETTEAVTVETSETVDDFSNVTKKPHEISNVTTVSDSPTTESVTNYTTVYDLPTVTPHRNYLTVEIRINCSSNEEQREISSSLAEFLNTSLKDSNECYVTRNVTLIVPNEKVEFLKISQFLMEKYHTIRLVRIWSNTRDYNGTLDNVTVVDDVTEREVVLYVSLGVCLGIVLLLAVAITCFKCFRKRWNKPLDLDVPHLNLRLEDYTLTRIPRPNTVYLDYYRGPIINDRYSSAPLGNSVDSTNPERGLIQPFDTSVVPLEDAKKLEELSAPVTRNETNCPSTPLRTFGRKDWKNGDGLIYENIMSSSTEKLHSDFFKSGNRGQDNPTFAA
ncbi:uncharacterized protein [Centruroides vittatus]|uniref:uncharacterized protein isoform X1 n=1 Tax=Centruroides vittatus TaxID=120091 RepID=UPI00350F41C2